MSLPLTWQSFARSFQAIKIFEVDPETIIFGEVGLTGEVRAVSMVEQRVMEARKLGFARCLIPQVNLRSLQKADGIRVEGIQTVQDVLRYIR